MKVFDLEGREWTVDRRFAPWRRWVQPIAGLTGGYRQHKLTADWKFPADDSMEEPEGEFVHKVARGLLGTLAVVEILVHVPVYVLLGLLLLPFLALELLCQGVAGSFARIVRWFRKAPARVDVAGWHKEHRSLASLTILKVRDDLAAPLVAELSGLLRGRVMFDPGDPAVYEVLTRFDVRVERHRTLLRRRSVHR
ncbi:hypothetical protein DMH03_22615 [Amycolatopsis sp. WAC 01376]|uniref:hypothetical protein n=1 Tax=Amycolatopsis sp. WAC 01376 TaxID=2203195 RepID=UPI000F78E5CC|nr:hypothetical protein [Amycolatopsis sp. WAC 01376]RSM61465.1 hypothetical protein DMH03_22615 [Amycolatopsis sp. WAC 01376]